MLGKLQNVQQTTFIVVYSLLAFISAFAKRHASILSVCPNFEQIAFHFNIYCDSTNKINGIIRRL